MGDFDLFLIDDALSQIADILIQVVSDPYRLLWSPPGGGFFVEAPEPPGPDFEPARMRTREGREIEGFATRILQIWPVAIRRRWEIGEPGSRRVLPGYQEGARSHLQLLGLLQSGAWAVVTARGLAARDLFRAWWDHVAWVRARLRTPDGQPLRPLAALLVLAAGKPRRVGSSMVTPFERVAQEPQESVIIPTELAARVKTRWAEIQAWAAAFLAEVDDGKVSPSVPAPTPEPEATAPEATPEVALEAPLPAPASPPAATPEGPGPASASGLIFLMSQGGEMALARLRRAFPDLPEDPAAAVRELARRHPQAGFWKNVPQAVDLFLAWAKEFPNLIQTAPARIRALKERLGIVPSAPRADEDLAVLAALAALRWLFRPRERETLERLLREP